MFVRVVLDQKIHFPLDYKVPAPLASNIKPGSRIKVPLKNTEQNATVIEVLDSSTEKGIRDVIAILSSDSLLSNDVFALAKWMAKYYQTPITKVYHTMLPSSIKKDVQVRAEDYLVHCTLSKPKCIETVASLRTKAPKQACILEEFLHVKREIFASDLKKMNSFSSAAYKALKNKKILREEPIFDDLLFEEDFFQEEEKKLTQQQEKACILIKESLDKRSFSPFLLHGVTGSGKTEVYMRAIKHALSLDLQTIFLVPEVALTEQTIDRFKRRFQDKVAILHYKLSHREKITMWNDMKEGKRNVVIGARSAIFAPMTRLGLIIVDEEHESSYKQMGEMPCFHARDVALVRAKMNNATIILGSATPSIESFYNAQENKYTLLTLDERAAGAKPPKTTIVDMNKEYERQTNVGLFSSVLLEKMKEKMAKGEQILLFLNKRGYFQYQICKNCKITIKCKHCDVSLTFHKGENILSCHLCNYHISPCDALCPECYGRDTLHFSTPGTEQVERMLYKIFPDIRTLRMDRDTTRFKHAHEEIIKQFLSHKADVLIGTQMIAKGLHFPSVTLVGILSFDSHLFLPDFRTNETTFSLLSQIRGRSGRGRLEGEVIIQTSHPDHPTILLSSEENYQQFYLDEIKERKTFMYPPFTRLIKFTIKGFDEKKTHEFAHTLHKWIQKLSGDAEIFPVIAGIHRRIKNRFYFQFFLKTTKMITILSKLHHADFPKSRSATFSIDVDPRSTF